MRRQKLGWIFLISTVFFTLVRSQAFLGFTDAAYQGVIGPDIVQAGPATSCYDCRQTPVAQSFMATSCTSREDACQIARIMAEQYLLKACGGFSCPIKVNVNITTQTTLDLTQPQQQSTVPGFQFTQSAASGNLQLEQDTKRQAGGSNQVLIERAGPQRCINAPSATQCTTNGIGPVVDANSGCPQDQAFLCSVCCESSCQCAAGPHLLVRGGGISNAQLFDANHTALGNGNVNLIASPAGSTFVLVTNLDPSSASGVRITPPRPLRSLTVTIGLQHPITPVQQQLFQTAFFVQPTVTVLNQTSLLSPQQPSLATTTTTTTTTQQTTTDQQLQTGATAQLGVGDVTGQTSATTTATANNNNNNNNFGASVQLGTGNNNNNNVGASASLGRRQVTQQVASQLGLSSTGQQQQQPQILLPTPAPTTTTAAPQQQPQQPQQQQPQQPQQATTQAPTTTEQPVAQQLGLEPGIQQLGVQELGFTQAVLLPANRTRLQFIPFVQFQEVLAQPIVQQQQQTIQTAFQTTFQTQAGVNVPTGFTTTGNLNTGATVNTNNNNNNNNGANLQASFQQQRQERSTEEKEKREYQVLFREQQVLEESQNARAFWVLGATSISGPAGPTQPYGISLLPQLFPLRNVRVEARRNGQVVAARSFSLVGTEFPLAILPDGVWNVNPYMPLGRNVWATITLPVATAMQIFGEPVPLNCLPPIEAIAVQQPQQVLVQVTQTAGFFQQIPTFGFQPVLQPQIVSPGLQIPIQPIPVELQQQQQQQVVQTQLQQTAVQLPVGLPAAAQVPITSQIVVVPGVNRTQTQTFPLQTTVQVQIPQAPVQPVVQTQLQPVVQTQLQPVQTGATTTTTTTTTGTTATATGAGTTATGATQQQQVTGTQDQDDDVSVDIGGLDANVNVDDGVSGSVDISRKKRQVFQQNTVQAPTVILDQTTVQSVQSQFGSQVVVADQLVIIAPNVFEFGQQPLLTDLVVTSANLSAFILLNEFPASPVEGLQVQQQQQQAAAGVQTVPFSPGVGGGVLQGSTVPQGFASSFSTPAVQTNAQAQVQTTK